MLDTVDISGDDVCCSVVFGTLVGVFSVMWSELVMTFVCSELGQGTTGCSGECCFGVMHGEWHGVCDSTVEACAEHDGVNVLHGCLNFGVVHGVGARFYVCGAACAAVCRLSLTSGCCLLCWDVAQWVCGVL